MRELDIQYPKHRDDFINRLKKQSDWWLKGGDDEDGYRYRRRGRRSAKPNKNIEITQNTKMYAPKRY